MPVIVAGDYGKGRSLAVTTDTLWRWGFVAAARPGDDGRHYTKFWENAMRWLIQDPDLRNLHVDSDAVEYVPGAPVRVDRPPARPRLSAAARTARSRSSSSAAPIRRAPSGRRPRSSTVGERRHRDARARRPRARRLPRRGPRDDRRPPGRRLATSSSSAKAAPSSTARPAIPRRSRPSPTARGGDALGPIEALPERLTFDPAAHRPRRPPDRRRAVEPPGPPVLVVGLLGLEWLLRQRSGYL